MDNGERPEPVFVPPQLPLIPLNPPPALTKADIQALVDRLDELTKWIRKIDQKIR